MAEQNKILTVSYGTFSCTLEGFEDSFGTMKAIAEYFRDLAADDRYFGAEPPSPDPEMLSRIAEREVARRVEARTSDQGIVLRAAEALAPPAEEPAPQPDTEEEPAPVAAAPVEAGPAETASPKVDETDQDAAEEAAKDSTAPEADADEVADVAPTVADATEADDAKIPAEAQAEVAEPQEAASDKDIVTDDTLQPEPDAGVIAEAEDDTSSEAAVASEEADEPDAAEDPVEEQAAADAPQVDGADDSDTDPAPDSVAAKLQRIRAVVGQGGALAASDDDVADAMAEEMEPDVAAEEALTAAIAPLDLGALGRRVAEADADADEATAPDAAIEATDDNAGDTAAAENADVEETAEVEPTPDALDPVRARVVRLAQDEPATEDVAEDDDAPAEDVAFAGLAALDGAEEFEDSLDGDVASLASDLDDDLLEELANVAAEAGEDSDLEAVAEDADAVAEETVDAVDDDVASVVKATETKVEEWKSITEAGTQGDDELVDTNEDEPENAFADLGEAEEVDETASEDGADAEAAQDTADLSGRNRLSEAPDADEAIARLMSEADAKMNEPEGRGRREAISHLKAAVAAKEAARQLGEEDDASGEDENAFREDLDEVVRPNHPSRPTRPAGEKGRSERPRPAPLKLVASQRIDAPAEDDAANAKDTTPVRPRRVSREAPGVQPAEGAFAGWAEQRGAFSLTELVEAAAAHTLSVDGVEAFSRPQVMRKVRAARTAEEANREDELRAFGTLLRQGRFTKVRAGRFHLADDSRFLETPRAAQG